MVRFARGGGSGESGRNVSSGLLVLRDDASGFVERLRPDHLERQHSSSAERTATGAKLCKRRSIRHVIAISSAECRATDRDPNAALRSQTATVLASWTMRVGRHFGALVLARPPVPTPPAATASVPRSATNVKRQIASHRNAPDDPVREIAERHSPAEDFGSRHSHQGHAMPHPAQDDGPSFPPVTARVKSATDRAGSRPVQRVARGPTTESVAHHLFGLDSGGPPSRRLIPSRPSRSRRHPSAT